MNIIRTLLAGVAGTSVMTLFSYIVSSKRGKNFEEPVLLNRLAKRIRRSGSEESGAEDNRPDGWLLHYATGFIFSMVYNQIWKRTQTAPTIRDGVILGAASGLIGIGIWDLSFRLHPDPPKVDNIEFYKHLLAAHIFYGLFAAMGYQLPEEMDWEIETPRD